MPCYNPLLAYRNQGKVVFKSPFPFARGFNLPCGQCVGCRLSYSRQWAVRCVHEAQMHDNNSFITLTYSPEELMKRENPWSLDVRDFQLFMKRLRKRYGKKVRFFHCGEYGDKNARPHYHALLFGHDFEDKKLWQVRDDVRLFISDELNELWPYGFSTIGDVSFQSAAYCARYVMKKITGDKADDHYTWIDPTTGEVRPRSPEYCTMSRNKGLGHDWLMKYKSDVYPNDYVVVNGHEIKPPRYYDSLLSEEELVKIKDKRAQEAGDPIVEYDDRMDRLWVKEQVKIDKLEKLVRNL
jgi:hypothetical protein